MMWHEVRKQEKKIRCMIVDYKRRAERRKDYYEKIKADPSQFLQVHGRPCKIHIDPAIAAAGDSSAVMMNWAGSPDILIDRFDVRAHLDFISDCKSNTSDGALSSDERYLNYERYRILVQNDFLRVPEEKFLHQLHLEEQYGASTKTGFVPIEGKKKVPGAAIGYNYEEPGSQSCSSIEPAQAEDSDSKDKEDEEEDDDSDLDFDVCVDVNQVSTQQAHELNLFSRPYGMEGNDFFSFLTRDKDEADNLRLAKELEEEKAMYSGKKSRRERRAYREKKLAGRKISPPSYASRQSPSYQEYKRQLKSHSKSRSPSPENFGQITYITSFGEEEDGGGGDPANKKKHSPNSLQKIKGTHSSKKASLPSVSQPSSQSLGGSSKQESPRRKHSRSPQRYRSSRKYRSSPSRDSHHRSPTRHRSHRSPSSHLDSPSSRRNRRSSSSHRRSSPSRQRKRSPSPRRYTRSPPSSRQHSRYSSPNRRAKSPKRSRRSPSPQERVLTRSPSRERSPQRWQRESGNSNWASYEKSSSPYARLKNSPELGYRRTSRSPHRQKDEFYSENDRTSEPYDRLSPGSKFNKTTSNFRLQMKDLPSPTFRRNLSPPSGWQLTNSEHSSLMQSYGSLSPPHPSSKSPPSSNLRVLSRKSPTPEWRLRGKSPFLDDFKSMSRSPEDSANSSPRIRQPTLTNIKTTSGNIKKGLSPGITSTGKPTGGMPRYYGRKKEESSSSELSWSEDENLSNCSSNNMNKNNSEKLAASSDIGNSSGRTKSAGGGGGTAASKIGLQERLKRKMQIMLNRQFKADKRAEKEKQERIEQERIDRKDELRELSIKLRKRERMKRHEYYAELEKRGKRSTSKSGSSSSDSSSHSPEHRSPPRRRVRRRSRSRSRSSEHNHSSRGLVDY